VTEADDKTQGVSPAADAAQVVATAQDAVVRVLSNDEGNVVASVAATPQGALVARVEELAAEYGIPLVQDALLTDLLTKVPSGDEIPENVYLAISEVLSCVYGIIEPKK